MNTTQPSGKEYLCIIIVHFNLLHSKYYSTNTIRLSLRYWIYYWRRAEYKQHLWWQMKQLFTRWMPFLLSSGIKAPKHYTYETQPEFKPQHYTTCSCANTLTNSIFQLNL